MARPTIGERAMSAAERKARSRANALGELVGQIERADRCLERLCRLRADDALGRVVLIQEARHALELAKLAVPGS